MVDTHSHLESIDNLENVLLEARRAGITKIISVGTSIESSKKSIKIAQQYSTDDLKIYATCGIHPKDGKQEIENLGLSRCIDTLKQLAETSKKVVGVGEAGLDYYVTGDKRQVTSDKEKRFQRELFEAQIKLAVDLKLPLVIHCRNGWGATFDLLLNVSSHLSNVKGVFHSWTGDWQAAKRALDLGFYISFSGIVTFKNAKDIQEVARKIPLEKLLLETDSPYLSPEPLRGEQNEPKNVKIVGKFIAGLRNQPISLIASKTSASAAVLFKI